MEDPLQPNDVGEHAGQEAALERTVLIAEALAGRVEPAEDLGPEQEGSGILRLTKKKIIGHNGDQSTGRWFVERFDRQHLVFVA